MNWHFKINEETEEFINIGYSYEQNETCDGIIKYHKSTQSNEIIKLSHDSGMFEARKGFQFIHGLIGDGQLTENIFHVRTG